MIFRFELAFDGEPQGVGILNGLDEVGLCKTIENDLYEQFIDLPAPKLQKPVSFWFTESGLNRFSDAIDRIIEEVSERNWQVLGAVMEDVGFEPVYRDDFQVAISQNDLPTESVSYKEIHDAKELKKSGERRKHEKR